MCTRWKSFYPYSRHFKEGLIGTGLAVFSRFEITSAHMATFPVNGAPWHIHRGDWYSGKGLCKVIVRVPVVSDFHDPTDILEADKSHLNDDTKQTQENLNIAVFNTHIHAEYNQTTKDMTGTRICQLYEARHAIESHICMYDGVIVAGDFNTQSDELMFRYFFKDDYGLGNHLNDLGANGMNCTSGLNEYSRNPKRIDYILASQRFECTHFTCSNVSDPTDSFSLSDHGLLKAKLVYDCQSDCTMQDRNQIDRRRTIDETANQTLIDILENDKRKRLDQARWFFALWLFVLALTIGFGAYSYVTVYIPGYPRTISLLLYILFPFLIFIGDALLFLWLFAREEAKVFERIANDL